MVIRNDKKRILVTLQEEVYKKLLTRAKQENRTISNMAATLLLEQLEK
jgi:hypothetical protein